MFYAGRRGIRFQDADGTFKIRQYGEAVPEAVNFPNIRVLLSGGFLIEENNIKTEDIKIKQQPKIEVLTEVKNVEVEIRNKRGRRKK